MKLDPNGPRYVSTLSFDVSRETQWFILHQYIVYGCVSIPRTTTSRIYGNMADFWGDGPLLVGWYSPFIARIYDKSETFLATGLSELSDTSVQRYHWSHRCRFSRNIGLVTPKIIYFYYQKIYFQDKSIQKKIYLILKKTSLVTPIPHLDSTQRDLRQTVCICGTILIE